MNNDKEEEKNPEYIQNYIDRLNEKDSLDMEGYKEFVRLGRKHKKAVQDYDEIIYPAQASRLKDWNKSMGQNKTINREAAINSINSDYQQKALALAKKYGYLEEKNNTPDKASQPDKSEGHGQAPEPEENSRQQAKSTQSVELTTREAARLKFLEQAKRVTEFNRYKEHERD